MKSSKVQTQLSFKNHSGNTVAFQKEQQQLNGAKAISDCHKCLRSVFRLQDFRGNQFAIVKAVLEGRDVFVIMPTGGGKSLCYQLPAVMSNGVTIVVSPLLALIHDQASALQRLGVKAAALNSSIGKKERASVMADLELKVPTLKLLYVTPELLATSEFRKHLTALHSRDALARLVIDEWGHDFRKDYAKLGYFRNEFPKLPILALTATATERVRQDIIKTLGLPDPPELCFFISSFNRDNLYYEVRFDNNNRYENFLGFLRGIYKSRRKRLQAEASTSSGSSTSASPTASTAPLPLDTSSLRVSSGFRTASTAVKASSTAQEIETVCGIIYCGQRMMCEDLANRLVGDGVMAAAFHSGMTPKQRANVQRRWCSPTGTETKKNGENDTDEKPIDVIVATIAFGMGIDKPNVRFVCHWELPKTIEGYYQESGRAGRDGDISRCILYYSREDRAKIEFLLEVEKERRRLKTEKTALSTRDTGSVDVIKNFQRMVSYCENVTQCRHVFLCEYFGEKDVGKKTVCKDGSRCDICRTPEKVAKEKAEKLSDIQGHGRQAQHMGGSKTFVGTDGIIQVQGAWQSASVALGRYDADLVGDEDKDDDDEASGSGDSSDEAENGNSSLEEREQDYDSEAERKAKRRKLLFGKAVDPSYYKRPTAPSAPTKEALEITSINKYDLSHSESTKIALRFRELCYETVERALSSLFQGSHRSLAADYFTRLAADRTSSLGKAELDARMTEFVKKLAVEIERGGFEASGTQNIYKSVLGNRVRDIKGFEAQARMALAALSASTAATSAITREALDPAPVTSAVLSAKPINQAWATAAKVWESLQQP
ncbi:P-loop containing nucleoside triphosphate hydrolase protein [Gamsiella multidivaricata]|uniref:P-loop containing nucleoside triphosphate hydrolase protein n=1 Tax=Gamsiella multidivaricata TaxID=101098 RepID=UPI00221F47C2|nr:P-loop containing nucleoside triphosphate hydrolase protein [Gamsiella multidivaricata]KAI7817914.1 P-loop containing nucleoside triphosphate hydrolase protein [Gamsiella multidivaricata]